MGIATARHVRSSMDWETLAHEEKFHTEPGLEAHGLPKNSVAAVNLLSQPLELR